MFEDTARRILRLFFGSGADISLANPLPVTAPALAVILPAAKAAIFNTALPAAEAPWLGANITPTSSPSYLRLYVCVAVAGVLRIARTVAGVTVVEDLNHGVQLAANSAYMFGSIEWRTGDSLNFRYSATGANILVFRVDEIGGAE